MAVCRIGREGTLSTVRMHGKLVQRVLTHKGQPCDICEGPCRFGDCAECGGHSEHNHGCRMIG